MACPKMDKKFQTLDQRSASDLYTMDWTLFIHISMLHNFKVELMHGSEAVNIYMGQEVRIKLMKLKLS